jgi:predicted PurR-regulated permease PerM
MGHTVVRIDRRSAAAFAIYVLIALAIAGLAMLLWQLAHVLVLLFAAILVAVILRACARPIARFTPLSERWGVVIVALAIILGILIGGSLYGASLRAQVGQVLDQLPDALQTLGERLGIPNIGDWLSAQFGGTDGPPNVVGLLERLVTSITGALGSAVLVLVGGVYIAFGTTLYREGLLKLFPSEEVRGRVAEVLEASGRALELWLLGQLVSMALVGILVGAGLWLIGVPAPLALGVFAALTDFIPFVGPFIGAAPGILLALLGGWTTALWAVLVYLIVQQLEGNLIVPLIQQRAVLLPPALTVFAVVAFGVIFGVWGVIIAAPLTVVVYVAVKKLWVREALGEPTEVPGEK